MPSQEGRETNSQMQKQTAKKETDRDREKQRQTEREIDRWFLSKTAVNMMDCQGCLLWEKRKFFWGGGTEGKRETALNDKMEYAGHSQRQIGLMYSCFGPQHDTRKFMGSAYLPIDGK